MQTDIKLKLEKMAETYSISTNTGCKVFGLNGDVLSGYPENQCALCKLVGEFESGRNDCRQSHIYGGLQAEKLGEPYIYFCPYGLVNWSVPIIINNELQCFLSGGPVLMHQVDELLIEDIIQQNNLLKCNKDRLKNILDNLQVIDTVRVRHLSELLFIMASNLMSNNPERLTKRKEINIISARIAETIHGLKNNTVKTVYPFEKENALISKVKLGDKKGAREILNEILGFIYFQSGNKFSIVKSKAIELMVVLARAAIEVGADLEIIFGLEYMYFEHINNVEDINQLSNWLTKVLDRFIECTFSIKNVKNKDIIYKAMNFIRSNYNKNISLDEVAEKVHLSPSYFSKLFKEEMDISYSNYVNRVRIEACKELLKKHKSLADIAQLVGFSDQSYFSKVFKRVEGVSPGKWRK